MRITLSLQTDLNVRNLHMVLGKNWLPDYWAVNRNLSVSLVKADSHVAGDRIRSESGF